MEVLRWLGFIDSRPYRGADPANYAVPNAPPGQGGAPMDGTPATSTLGEHLSTWWNSRHLPEWMNMNPRVDPPPLIQAEY